MPTTVRVFGFKYFDRDAKAMRLAHDFALPRAIEEIGGEIQSDTYRDVDRSCVRDCGFLAAPPID